jgi:hypothetical protein
MRTSGIISASTITFHDMAFFTIKTTKKVVDADINPSITHLLCLDTFNMRVILIRPSTSKSLYGIWNSTDEEKEAFCVANMYGLNLSYPAPVTRTSTASVPDPPSNPKGSGRSHSYQSESDDDSLGANPLDDTQYYPNTDPQPNRMG